MAHKSDSTPWLEAEHAMLGWLNRRDGLDLVATTIPLNNGTSVAVDGASTDRQILCEIYGRLGPVAVGTQNKVCADAMKLIWLRDSYFQGARLIVVIANAELHKRLTSAKAWRARVLRESRVELLLAELTDDQRQSLHRAEADAREGMIPVPPDDMGADDDR